METVGYWTDGVEALPSPKDGEELWYTERQGDCLLLRRPAGGGVSTLPTRALGWVIQGWTQVPTGRTYVFARDGQG